MTEQIIHGDSLHELAKLADDSVDLVVTSPPYDNLRTYCGNYSFDFEGIAKHLFRLIKPGGVIVWVVGDATVQGTETGSSFRQALHFMQLGLNLHDTMIYQKKSCYAHDPRNKRYKAMFEYMFVFSKGAPLVYNEIKDVPNKHAGKILKGTKGRDKQGNKRPLKEQIILPFQARSNIWLIASSERSPHPAIFPLALARDHIITWTNPGDTVLDPFVGSGTTCLAAKQLNRQYIGIEREQEYVEIAQARIKQEVQAVLL